MAEWLCSGLPYDSSEKSHKIFGLQAPNGWNPLDNHLNIHPEIYAVERGFGISKMRINDD